MICPQWSQFLESELKEQYAIDLKNFVTYDRSKHKVFPSPDQVFNAFNLTPFNSIKVVIIGQDPYHGEGQAHGLAFSVQNSKLPPSLVNIYKEIKEDVGQVTDQSGDLTHWAQQGVLLLNTYLTVREGSPGSHADIGWSKLTSAALEKIALEKKNIVFILWGKHAAALSPLINLPQHMLLFAAHPSPLSAYKGFFGCKHFSQTNQYLIKNDIDPIRW